MLLLRALRFGEDIDGPMRDLGVTWIVALPDLDDGDIAALRRAEGVETVVDDEAISLFRSRGVEAIVPVDPVDPGDLTAWDATATAVLMFDVVWAAALVLGSMITGMSRSTHRVREERGQAV